MHHKLASHVVSAQTFALMRAFLCSSIPVFCLTQFHFQKYFCDAYNSIISP